MGVNFLVQLLSCLEAKFMTYRRETRCFKAIRTGVEATDSLWMDMCPLGCGYWSERIPTNEESFHGINGTHKPTQAQLV